MLLYPARLPGHDRRPGPAVQARAEERDPLG